MSGTCGTGSSTSPRACTALICTPRRPRGHAGSSSSPTWTGGTSTGCGPSPDSLSSSRASPTPRTPGWPWHTAPSLALLPGVAGAVKGDVPIIFDGGVRRGTDVLKALALGADAVGVGRPVLWGLAAAGQDGVSAVLQLLRAELLEALLLCGCGSLTALDERFLFQETERSSWCRTC